jgi:hypothetical protein
LTTDEIKDYNLRLSELLKRFFANDPEVAANLTLGQLVAVYLLRSGADWRSNEFRDQFVETMSKLVPVNPGSLAGSWIFKATESVGTALSGNDERVFVGLASVSSDGEDFAIVSSSGTTEMNFTGTLSKGRLSGQVGVGGVSAKCEGAATVGKISISFRSLTSDGTIQGNVVLERAIMKQDHNEKANPVPSTNRSRASTNQAAS